MTLSFRIMEEILNVLDEDVYSAIRKKHGEPEYDDLHHTGPNKSYELMDTAQKAKYHEVKGAAKREAKSEEDIVSKRKETKNSKGMSKTKDRSKGALDPFDNDKINWSNYTNDDKVEKSIARHNKKVQEALSLMEQICDFADNLFELDIENKQNISPNKISKVKKDKDGKDVEVVSVADELFPHDGTAKQQFDKKILDKINDMIEGTGSLEDLIQFVRKGVANKKLAHEGLDEAKDAKGYKENMDIANHYDHLYSKEPANSPDGSPNPVAAEWKRKYQEYFDKAMKCHYGDENKSKKVLEALEILEDIYDAIRKSNKSVKEKSELTTKAMTTQGKELVDTAKREGKLATDIMVKRSPYNTKNANGERHTNTRRERIPFNDNCKLKAHESVNVSEDKNIFGKETGKGDLLNDIDTGLGSPVKKRFNALKDKVVGCKEAFDLMEDIFSTINKSIHNPSKRKELTDKVKEIQGDRLASEKDVVKRGGRAATRKENGETIYTFDAPDYDRDRPKSKEKEELEMSKSYGIVPTNKERRHAEYEQAVKDADSIHRSMSKHYKKHEVDSDTRGKNWDKSIEYIEKDWKDRKEKLGN